MKNISDVYAEICNPNLHSKAYQEKMIHEIPIDATVVKREEFIVERCKDKVVYHLGCIGPLHSMIEKEAKEAWGFDKLDNNENIKNYVQIDFEKTAFPIGIPKPEIIICGELLEHLSNPGMLLDNLHFDCPIIVTAPNAFSSIGWEWVTKKQLENVNKDHVAYYSYWTLKTLLERHNFDIKEFYWYNGLPIIAEGLVFVVENKNGRI